MSRNDVLVTADWAEENLGAPGLVFSTTQTQKHLGDIVELIAPQGRFALIDDPDVLDVMPFKRKSVSIHWELMFTRSLFATPDMDAQGRLLTEVAKLVDAGRLRTTLTRWRRDGLAPVDFYAIARGGHTVPNRDHRAPLILGRTQRDLDAGELVADFFGLANPR